MSDDLYRSGLPPFVQPEDRRDPNDPTGAGPDAFDRIDLGAECLAPEDVAVLIELERLQNQRPSWWGGIALLVVSVLLYTGAFSLERAIGGVMLFIPVLLFHELGHFVAMRVFGYKNVRMFFIPFLGAAVSGRHYNVSGWKKAVVALMGPVPGIVLGVPIGLAGLLLDQSWMLQLASLMMILNGFNLLPFLPLDGGWVVHAILFVRHPLVDVAFRVLTGLALVGVAYLLSSWMLVALGVVTLLGIPMAWRMARIAYDLGQRGVVSLSPDAESIPTEAALPILAEVRKVLPPQTTPPVLAQSVASVFETLNAYPPGLLASIGLLTAHAVSFVAALAFTFVFAFLHRLPG